MSAGRKIVYVAGGGLLVAWIAAANMPSQDAERASERARPAPSASPVTIADDVNAQAARLQARMAQAPAPESTSRNPFAFGMTPRHPRGTDPVAAAAVAEAPMPAVPPPPALTLMGIAEEYVIGGFRRTAVIALREPQGDPEQGRGVGGEADTIFMVTEGDPVGDRYKVTKIGVDAIELEDLVTKAYRRLALR